MKLRSHFLYATALGGTIFFILAIFQPFGTEAHQSSVKYLELAGYGALSFSVYLATTRFFQAKNWLQQDHPYPLWAFWMVQLVLGIVFSYPYYIFLIVTPAEASYSGFWAFAKFSTYITLLPIFLVSVLMYLQQTRQKTKEQHEVLETVIAEQEKAVSEKLTFTSQSEKDHLSISTEQLLWLQAQENYVEFCWEVDQKVQTTLLRNTLAKVSKELPPQFARTHRSFWVNLNRVEKLTKRNTGYELLLGNSPEKIPVSKTYAPVVASYLREHLPHLRP